MRLLEVRWNVGPGDKGISSIKTTLRKRYSSDFKAQIIDLFNLGKTVPQLAEKFGFNASRSEYKLPTPMPFGWVGGTGALVPPFETFFFTVCTTIKPS